MVRRIGKALKILAVVFIVASAVACVEMYGFATGGISEDRGKVVPLVPPPLLGVASAAGITSGNAFPVDEAGLAAYVNVGKRINISEAVKAFIQIEDISETHAIGIVSVYNWDWGTVNVHVYVDTNGYIVAYFKKTEPASNIIKWSNMDFSNPTISFTTDAAIKKVCDKIGVYYPDIKDKIKYYDFRYPNANKMVVFLNARKGAGDEYVHIFIPTNYRLYEASYSLYDDDCHSETYLYVDGQRIRWLWCGVANHQYDIEKVLTVGKPHTIHLKVYGSGEGGGVGNVLIYREG